METEIALVIEPGQLHVPFFWAARLPSARMWTRWRRRLRLPRTRREPDSNGGSPKRRPGGGSTPALRPPVSAGTGRQQCYRAISWLFRWTGEKRLALARPDLPATRQPGVLGLIHDSFQLSSSFVSAPPEIVTEVRDASGRTTSTVWSPGASKTSRALPCSRSQLKCTIVKGPGHQTPSMEPFFQAAGIAGKSRIKPGAAFTRSSMTAAGKPPAMSTLKISGPELWAVAMPL